MSAAIQQFCLKPIQLGVLMTSLLRCLYWARFYLEPALYYYLSSFLCECMNNTCLAGGNDSRLREKYIPFSNQISKSSINNKQKVNSFKIYSVYRYSNCSEIFALLSLLF